MKIVFADAKEAIKVFDEYEAEIVNTHIKLLTQKESASADTREKRDRLKTITAAQIQAVREIRDRLGIPEIKA